MVSVCSFFKIATNVYVRYSQFSSSSKDTCRKTDSLVRFSLRYVLDSYIMAHTIRSSRPRHRLRGVLGGPSSPRRWSFHCCEAASRTSKNFEAQVRRMNL
jgi:hypothetical protein